MTIRCAHSRRLGLGWAGRAATARPCGVVSAPVRVGQVWSLSAVRALLDRMRLDPAEPYAICDYLVRASCTAEDWRLRYPQPTAQHVHARNSRLLRMLLLVVSQVHCRWEDGMRRKRVTSTDVRCAPCDVGQPVTGPGSEQAQRTTGVAPVAASSAVAPRCPCRLAPNWTQPLPADARPQDCPSWGRVSYYGGQCVGGGHLRPRVREQTQGRSPAARDGSPTQARACC
jgi:hypothetical protein